jgi:isoleucyl-tRNA synthetase
MILQVCPGFTFYFESSSTHDFEVTISFPLVDDPNTSMLAWTTTPWTLPSNLALCVHPDFQYIKIYDEEQKQHFILHENRLPTLYKDPKKAKFKKVAQYQGSDMKGWRYVPVFEYFTEQVGRRYVHTREISLTLSQFEDRAFRVVVDTYVTADDGTGIVHQAPAFGDDDHRIALAHNILTPEEMPPCPVDDSGKFTNEVPDFAGEYIKV